MEYIVHHRCRELSAAGDRLNLPYGTRLNTIGDFIATAEGRAICFTTSELAHRYMARNDDGRGLGTGQGLLGHRLQPERARSADGRSPPAVHPTGRSKCWSGSGAATLYRTQRPSYSTTPSSRQSQRNCSTSQGRSTSNRKRRTPPCTRSSAPGKSSPSATPPDTSPGTRTPGRWWRPTAEDAIGVSVAGTLYNLNGGSGIPDAPEAVVSEVEGGEMVFIAISQADAVSTTSGIAFVAMAEAGTIDGVTAGEHADLFSPWAYPVNYTVGQIRRYTDGKLYKCLQAHTSQADWTPDTAVSLWVSISDPAEEWPEWSQPLGAHDAYSKGAKVSHNGKHWISDLDANVWEPGQYGWTEAPGGGPGGMSNLQMIEALCTLCEEQSRIIRAMALRLGELGDTALKDEIAKADARYRQIIGSEEWPDPCPEGREEA